MAQRKFKTERLLIREIKKSDRKDIHEYASDSEVCRYVLWGPNTPADTTKFINKCLKQQKLKKRERYDFAIILGKKLIGCCSLFGFVDKHKRCEIGYVINRKYWRNGYASEAARKMVELAMEELGMHRVFAVCRKENIASSKVMQKAGMTYEGLLKENVYIKGKWADTLIYGIVTKKNEVKRRK